MKIRHPAVIGLFAVFAGWLIRWWIGSLRCRIVNWADRPHPTDGRHERFIYSFWHETLMFHLGHRTRVNVLISQHADGEVIAQVCRRVGFNVVRGSSTRGGVKVLLEMVRSSGRGNFAVTPDGPRGPRRRVQPGMIFLASRTGLPIVPFGIGYARAWRAKSWDRFGVPMPWSKVVFVIGPALTIGGGGGSRRYRLLPAHTRNDTLLGSTIMSFAPQPSTCRA